MSIQSVESFEENFGVNKESCSIDDWKDVFANTSSMQFFLHLFRKCSEHFLAYIDRTNSSIVHGLIKSQMSTNAKLRSLKILLIRDVNCNKPDDNGKSVLDYLIEDNDYECIEVLLQYGRNLEVSDECLSGTFQLRNKQEEVFRLLFAHAVKHNIAPHLTGVSNGDTFLHDIVLQEKEKEPFKKWMGYFLSFSKVNINAVNNDGLTVFDLLLLNYEKKRCKYAIKLLLKHRCPNISNDDYLELPLFLLNQKIISQQFKAQFLEKFSKKVPLSMYLLKSDACVADSEVSFNESKSSFSPKYLKPKQFAPCSFIKSSYMSSPNNTNSSIMLPNHEEADVIFEIKMSDEVFQGSKAKSSQKDVTKVAKVKNYLSTNEAIVYHNYILGKNSKIPYICNKWGQGSYSTVCVAHCNGLPCIARAACPFHTEKSNNICIKEVNMLSFLNHPRNELLVAAYSTQSIPKLYPIMGLCKELPGTELPPPIPLDLPKINFSRKVTSIISHNQVVREQPMKTGSGLGTVQGTEHDSNVMKQQPMASTHQQQQQASLSQSMDFSDPVGIISRAAVFLTAGDYKTMIRLLEILDKHLVLPEDIDLAKEFGQGLAHYKNLHYRSAKPSFNALFEKSVNYGSSVNQALASIYSSEIEMSWAKYKDAEKHFTLAMTYYSSNNVAEKFQETISTKSAVLVKKGQCHWSLLQIKEAINAFKMAKAIAELAQQQTRGSKLKTAKEDELSALCALGNILQSIGDYEQSFEYYEKSLKLAGELGDHISVGWAHGNLGNTMLGLDQKYKALDHLIMAFHMSARYKGNPLAVGRAVSNLGNAYQAIGNLPKAKEYYEIALGHAIYGNDLQGQGRACGNIGNVYMLLKEPVKAVHYYTETLRLSTDKNTKITGYHNRGCATYDVAECILQGKKPKELVIATTPDSAYGTLTIKLTDEVITTDPVQETKPNREPSAQSVSEQRESSMAIETLKVYRLNNDQVANIQLAEARPFLEAAKKDLLQAIESHEQSVQNVKGSHDALSLSLSLFESNSRSFYKIQETLVELGKLLQQLSELDMVAAEPQEFKDALVYGEQARARTLGELVLQKKKTMYSDLFSISTPLKIQDIYETVELQKVPVVFISYCVTKLLIWILVPVKDEVIMKCQSIDLKEEELENSSFELYIRYNLLQFLSKDEIYIFRQCSYEQESPFTVLHDVIGVKIIEGLKSVEFSEVTEFIVIPDSVTHLLPFCPLMNKENWQFFGDKYRIRIVPSFLSLLVMPQTSAGASHVGLKVQEKIREAAAKPNSTVMGNSLYTCSSSNTFVFSSNYDSVMEPMTSTAQELLLMDNSESLSLNIIGHSRYSPSHTIPTISCSGISVDETIFQESVLCQRSKKTARGYGDGSSSSSDDGNNNEDKREIHTSFASHYHSSNPQHSVPNSPRYKSLSAAVNTSLTPQTSAGTSHVGLKHEGKMREAAAKPNSTVMGFMLLKSPAMYTSKGDYLIGDSYSLAERGPILLNVPNGRNELVMAAYSTQSIPKLYPIVGLHKELPGIALPPPIPLDLPKINFSRKVTSIISHNQVVREQPMKTGSGLGAVQGIDHDSNVMKQQPMASTHQQQQQATLTQSVDFSDPVGIISRAAVFLTAGDYGTMIRLLEILDKHLVLPEDIDMAKEFGQGLAHYKNQHYRSAKPCFNALFEKSINYSSSGNQALASIYLGEIEMSWAKYKDAEKHFTLAVTYYSSDNVAEKFQETILTKSTVLRRKGQCHWRLSQIREAISAFKMAKDEAVWVKQQTRRSTLKTAKKDELSALFELGNILRSIGDHEQSFEYYEKSLKLAGELEDHVSEGRAHGSLGNVMLGLNQKDKALDHLVMAFQMSAKYEGNPLVVGRAVSILGNAYQAIGDLPKAKEYYEIALGHAIYGNDLQDQGRAYGNIGNVYMLLKEPVKAVHYYTETLRLSTDKDTKITGYHDRGCARYDVAECILQGKKPKELVIATTPNSVYGRLTIKLTDEVITTDPVQETTEPSAQSVSGQRESSMSIEMLPKAIKGKTYDGLTNVKIAHLVEALPFLEAAASDLLVAIQSHEQSIQNVKGSPEALGLSLSLFESNSRSFYKMQETLVELGKLRQRLSELGVMDMVAAEPQEFNEALVYGEQARARILGELNLQKNRAMYSDLFSISTPLKIQDIYRTVELQNVPAVFISYCVSKLLMWILVSVEDKIIMKCQSIDLKEEELENSSFELYIRYNLLRFLSKEEIYIFRRCSYEQESPFTVLHDVIGVKIIEGLKSVGCSEITEFIVIPDSVTHLLPFCPLMNKENWQFFGDKYRIRIVPSFLSLLVMSMTGNPVVEVPGDNSDFLIVGNPTIPPFMYNSTQWNLGRLPYAEKEAISVANIIGTVPVLREQATKQSVLYRLRSAKVIHLATHGSASAMFLAFTSSFPISKSGLAEKEHILIFPKEIETLNISLALVVLSSCDSARGQVKAEGVIGMARAFLSAGAHSVLVSLWRVPDESANIFMQFFYQFLVNGLPSLAALQRSMHVYDVFSNIHIMFIGLDFRSLEKKLPFTRIPMLIFPSRKC